MSDLPEYVLDRVFEAQREMVWRAWTDPELLARWYGPNVETIIHGFDLKPGGHWLNEMRWDGGSHFSKATFQAVELHEKLVWLHANTDADWNVTANAMMPDWPKVVLTVVAFEDLGAQTKVRLTWVPHEASEAEIACFAGAMERMGQGWESGYKIMDEIFAELQSAGL